MSEREMLQDHGTELVKLKPSSLLQAARADLRRRERNAIEAHEGGYSFEQFAFHRAHVRKAVDEQDLLVRALMEPGRGLASAKYNTRLIYGDGGTLLAAIHLAAVDRLVDRDCAMLDGKCDCFRPEGATFPRMQESIGVTPAAIFLCDLTGNAAIPWAEAGFDCFCVDVQHSIRADRIVQIGAGRIHYVWGDVRSWTPPARFVPVFGAAFTECTHVAGSGARDWPKKRGFMLRDALEQFEAARQCFEWARCPYALENSVGLFSSIPHIGKPTHYFEPWQYAGWCESDNYTKKTCIWSGGGFVMPARRLAPELGKPDDRIHKASPGDDRANFRSASPLGFWRAVFEANAPTRARGQWTTA